MHQYDSYQCQQCGLPTGEVCVGQGGATCKCNVPPYDPTPHFIDPKYDNRPANRSHRFRPRLKMTAPPGARMLVQVHPETIEVFDMKGVYLCQVKLIRGEMYYTQGGLPLKQLKAMFKGTL